MGNCLDPQHGLVETVENQVEMGVTGFPRLDLRCFEDLAVQALFARTDFEVHVDWDAVSRGRERAQTFVLKLQGGRFPDAGLPEERERRVAVKLGKGLERVRTEGIIHWITQKARIRQVKDARLSDPKSWPVVPHVTGGS